MSAWTVVIADAMRTAGTLYLWLYWLRTLRQPVVDGVP